MTVAARKQAERDRRKAEGQVALSGWLSASDHAALTQMARDSGMTQGQVVSRLIGMVGAVRGLERLEPHIHTYGEFGGMSLDTSGDYVHYDDLTAAVGL